MNNGKLGALCYLGKLDLLRSSRKDSNCQTIPTGNDLECTGEMNLGFAHRKMMGTAADISENSERQGIYGKKTVYCIRVGGTSTFGDRSRKKMECNRDSQEVGGRLWEVGRGIAYSRWPAS